MSNLWSTHQDVFVYADGTKIYFSVRIDRRKLGKLVWAAANNKRGKKVSGALVIEAKKGGQDGKTK